jgi:hypothetical protein
MFFQSRNYSVNISKIYTFILDTPCTCIYSMYLKFLNTFRSELPHIKTRKKVHINLGPQEKNLIFEVQPPRSPDLNPLVFYLCGHLKKP